MGQKNVSFWLTDLNNDVIVVLGNMAPTISNPTASNLCGINSQFFIAQDDQGESYLCTTIQDGATLSGVASNNNFQYPIESVDFIGGHPVHRPPHGQ